MTQLTRTALLLLLSAAGQAIADTSAFDSAFGDNGRILGTGFDIASLDVGRSVIALSDGKFLIAGTTSTIAGKGDLLVTRLLADGNIDTSFGQHGSVALDGAGGDDFGYHAIKQTDGKILVAGNCQTDKTVSCIFRLNTDGSIDTNFAQQGKFLYTFADGDGSSRITKLALQSDGKIIAVGARELGSSGINADPFAMRLTTAGAIDTSYATNGIYVSASAGGDWAEAVAIDGNNRAVLAIDSVGNDLVAERLTSAGALDTDFNGNGRASYDGGGTDWPHTIAIDTGNEVLLGGRSATCGWGGNPCIVGANAERRWNAVIVRFDDAGTLDTSFAVSGVATLDNLGNEYVTEIVPTGSGGIYFGGPGYFLTTSDTLDYFTFVGHLTADGTALSFGDRIVTVNGASSTAHVTKPGNRQTVFLRGLTLLASGELIYAGTGYDDDESSLLMLTKLDASGAAVAGFQSNGIKLFSAMQDGVTRWLKSIRQDDNHQILVGQTGAGNLLLSRIDNSGSFDTSFGDAGVLLFDNGGEAAQLADVTIAADGSIALAYATNLPLSSPEVRIRRLSANGQPLTVFGADGVLTTSFGSGYDTSAVGADGLERISITMLANGSAVVAASGRKAGVSEAFLARFDSNGVAESITSAPALGDFELHALAADSSNRLYLAGSLAGHGKVCRLTAGGSLDTGFASSGWMTVAGDADAIEINRLTLLAGNLYAVGSSEQNGDTIGFVTKANQNGTLDSSFGSAGSQHYPFGADQSEIADLQLRADGKLLLTGARFQTTADSDGKLVFLRTLANGGIESSYGINGLVTDSSAEASSGSSAIAIAGGRAIVAGKCGSQACLLRAATDNGALTASALVFNFGSLTAGNTGSAQVLTLTNTGAGPLTLGSIAVSGEFSASSSCPVGELASAANCTISIRFAPTSAGAKTGALNIGAETGSTVIALSGTGVAQSPTPPPAEGGGGGGGGGSSSLFGLLLMLPLLRRRQRG